MSNPSVDGEGNRLMSRVAAGPVVNCMPTGIDRASSSSSGIRPVPRGSCPTAAAPPDRAAVPSTPGPTTRRGRGHVS